MKLLYYALLGLFLVVCDSWQCSQAVGPLSPADGLQDESGLPEPNEADVQPHQLPSEISPATDEDLRKEERAG